MAISTDMLEAFVKVADRLSVSAAAADLGIGKSMVSKRVALLEEAVRSTLFSRSTRKVALTPAGEIYLDFARRALVEVVQAQERLRDLRSELAGLIRVTAPVSWGQRVLAPLIPGFLRLHPAIEIELLLGDRLMDVAHERIDIALRWSAAPAPDLVTTPIARVDWIVCAAPAYVAVSGAPAEPEDLAGHSCMNYWRESSDGAWVLSHGGRSVNVRVRSRYRANNPEAVADAALAGLGIALLPLYTCADALADGRLVRVLAPWEPATRFGAGISAVAAPDRARFQRNQALLAYLKEACNSAAVAPRA